MPWTKSNTRTVEPTTVPEETAAILDGLYAAITDAGVAQREAVDALREARATSDVREVPVAEASLKQATADLMQVGMVYRLALHKLPDDTRGSYLAERHPHLQAG